MIEQQERRLVSLTVALVNKGLLPAFYRIPSWQHEMERGLEKALRSLFDDFGTNLLKGLEAGTVIPTNEAMVSWALGEDIDRLLPQIADAYQTWQLSAAQKGFDRIAWHIARKFGIQIDWEMASPRARQVIEDLSFKASEKLMERITGDVKAALLKGLDEGLGTREIGDLLRGEIRDLSERQAEGIARTEINSAQNIGAFQGYVLADVEYIQWITANDARVRDTHIVLHGMVVRVGERFPGGLLHPGDRAGTDISMWIACRCTHAPYIPTDRELGLPTPFIGYA